MESHGRVPQLYQAAAMEIRKWFKAISAHSIFHTDTEGRREGKKTICRRAFSVTPTKCDPLCLKTQKNYDLLFTSLICKSF